MWESCLGFTDQTQAAFPLELQYKYVNINNYKQEKKLELASSFESTVFVDYAIFSKKVWGSVLVFYCHIWISWSLSFQNFYTVFLNGDMERILITFSIWSLSSNLRNTNRIAASIKRNVIVYILQLPSFPPILIDGLKKPNLFCPFYCL